MALVQSLLSRSLITTAPAETVADAVKRMAELQVGALVVVDDGELVGILSERDVLKRVIAAGRDPEATRVADVATPDPERVVEGAHVKECAELIRRHGFRHLPVVDEEGMPIGIISSRDFLQYVVDELENLIERAASEERLEELTDPYDFVGEDGWDG
jgi:CBS domain-containing protein